MSVHLIGCAAGVKQLGRSQKLALLAFADSADDRTHIAFPGYEGVMMWAGVSRSRAAEIIRDLVDAGYVRQHSAARRGRRAEYVVFPDGCCALHRTPTPEAPVDVDALAEAAGVTTLQAQAMLDALQPTDPTEKGSEKSDPQPSGRPARAASHTIGSEISDPVPGQPSQGPGSRTRTADRVQNGSEISDPSTTPTTSPLAPQATTAAPSPAGPTPIRCSRHRTAPGDNCRACGTTPRQLAADAERRKRAELASRAELEKARARQSAAQARAQAVSSTDVAPTLLQSTRQQIAASKAKTTAGARR